MPQIRNVFKCPYLYCLSILIRSSAISNPYPQRDNVEFDSQFGEIVNLLFYNDLSIPHQI